MDVFIYSRDAAGTTALRNDDDLLEAHWSYMDAFAESMIARGPTFARDRETVSGSLHILALPSVDAARDFVAGEPNNRAGVYAEHRIWRFQNLLGRTMWDFEGPADEPRFLIIARPVPTESLSAGLREQLIVYGALSTLVEDEPAGIALAIQARNREAVDALLAGEQERDVFRDAEIHDWEFGGRR